MGHSGSFLSFSCQNGIAYYSKFILLSLAYFPNIVVSDMARIVAKHAKTMQSISVKVTRKGLFSIHSMGGWLIQTDKRLCKWQMTIIFTCIFHGFLNKSNRKTKLALKVIHIQLLVAMSICASSINFMKAIRPPKSKL